MYYRQLSADNEIKNYLIKPSFVSPEGLMAKAKNTNIIFMIFISIFVKNCLQYNVIHDFSVWPRTGSNLADINRFQATLEKNMFV